MTKKFSPPLAEEISLTAAEAFAKILAEVIDLLKKIFAAVIVVLMFSSQASAMHLTIGESVGSIGLGADAFTLKIDGGKKIAGDDSKGAVLFGNLYFHFDAFLLKEKMPQAKSFDEEQKIFDRASRFGGKDVENCVPVFVFEGWTKIIPISNGDGREFYLLATETGGGSMKVIGERDGVWVKYFDTYDTQRQLGGEFYMKDFYAAGDKIVFVYEEWNTKATRELHYQWDAAAQWFGVELK